MVTGDRCGSCPYLVMISKGRKRGLGECEIVLIFRAKDENEDGTKNCRSSKNVNLCLLDSVESVIRV